MANDLSQIYEIKSEKWGRGDSYLWDEMQEVLGGESLDISTRDLANLTCKCYEKVASEPLRYDSKVFVERFAHGGMSGYVSDESSGYVVEFLFLIDNFRKIKHGDSEWEGLNFYQTFSKELLSGMGF